MPKLTIHDLFAAKKSGKTFTEIRTSNLNEALACAAAGVELIMCMEEDLPVIRPEVPNVFIIAAHNVNDPRAASPEHPDPTMEDTFIALVEADDRGRRAA